MRTLQRQNESLKNEVQLLKISNSSHLKNVDTSMRRMCSFPASRRFRRSNNDANDAASGVSGATNQDTPTLHVNTLTKTPKTLHTLWTEWEFGIAGNKPAKRFIANERGRVRFQYSLRKGFWDLCSQMICHGYTSDSAIDKIYSVYPGLPLTKILRKIRSDRKTGGNPALMGTLISV